MKLILYILLMSFLFALTDWSAVDWKYHNREGRYWLDHHEQLYADVVWTTELILSPISLAMKPHFYYLLYNTAPQQEQKDMNHWGYDGNPLLLNGIGRSQGRYSGLPWTRISLKDWYMRFMPAAVLWLLAIAPLLWLSSRRKTAPQIKRK